MEWPKACSLFTGQEPQQGPQEPQQGLQKEESLQEQLRRKKKITLHYCMLSKSALLQIVCETS